MTAPSIYENEDIKKGILCQLFGGANKDFTEAGRGKFRSVQVCKLQAFVMVAVHRTLESLIVDGYFKRSKLIKAC